MLRILLAVALFLTCSECATAAEIKPLQVHTVTGEHAAKDIDYIAERKTEPTVVVFINAEQWTRPVARYLKVLDSELEKGVKGSEKAQVVAVWLSDDANHGREYLPKVQMSLNLAKTALTVFEGPKSGPEGWNVDIAAQLTVVIIREGKERARFDYRSTNDQDVPEVIKSLAAENER